MKKRTKRILSLLPVLAEIKSAMVVMVQEAGNERPYRVTKDFIIEWLVDGDVEIGLCETEGYLVTLHVK